MRHNEPVLSALTTIFACSEKVVSSVHDACGRIQAAGHAVASARHTHTAQWLRLFISRSGDQTRFSTESFSIHVDRFPFSWSSFYTEAILGKTTAYDREHAYFRLARVLRNLRLARIIHDCRREAFENVCRGSSGHIVLVRVLQLRPKAFGREDGRRTHQ